MISYLPANLVPLDSASTGVSKVLVTETGVSFDAGKDEHTPCRIWNRKDYLSDTSDISLPQLPESLLPSTSKSTSSMSGRWVVLPFFALIYMIFAPLFLAKEKMNIKYRRKQEKRR
jgi:hypothetical protein